MKLKIKFIHFPFPVVIFETLKHLTWKKKIVGFSPQCFNPSELDYWIGMINMNKRWWDALVRERINYSSTITHLHFELHTHGGSATPISSNGKPHTAATSRPASSSTPPRFTESPNWKVKQRRRQRLRRRCQTRMSGRRALRESIVKVQVLWALEEGSSVRSNWHRRAAAPAMAVVAVVLLVKQKMWRNTHNLK